MRRPVSPGVVSPWARLLDYLSWKYRVLFVVSAGNIPEPFEVPGYLSGAAMRAAVPEHRRAELLRAIDAARSQRTIFAPAESVNALTVGAAHCDGSTLTLPSSIADPYGDRPVPILSSGLGHGFNRSVKPDVLLPGGRQIALATEGPMLRVHGREHADRYGQLVATPDPATGHLDFTRMSAGTSNAAALATRMGLLLGDVLDESPINAGMPWQRRDTAPCVLKALIAHGASWGDLGQEMTEIHIPAGGPSRRKEAVSRAMGYGPVDGRLVDGGGHRMTLLGEDRIRKEQRPRVAHSAPGRPPREHGVPENCRDARLADAGVRQQLAISSDRAEHGGRKGHHRHLGGREAPWSAARSGLREARNADPCRLRRQQKGHSVRAGRRLCRKHSGDRQGERYVES